MANAAGLVHVFYATQTGNAEVVAEDAAEVLEKAGFEVRTAGLDEVTPAELAVLERVAVVCSSTGTGDVPDDLEEFWVALLADGAPRLDAVTYSLCALGDRGYQHFCGGGRKVDERFAELGATRLLDRVDCDSNYEDAAADWMERLAAALADRDGS